MSDPIPRSRRIHFLRDEVFRKIAAGEVIDRPFSIVRELLDNAIDAGSSSIDVHLEAGGLSRVRVVDDGAGMDCDDLSLCWQPHTTSKIDSEDDLLRVTSLGFRGEALASIALCSKLEVVSKGQGAGPAYRLEVREGRQQSLEPCQGRPGTTVDVSELFFNYPARRKFLRSASAESGLCRSAFLDKAVAHPAIAFRLFIDGALKISLPPGAAGQRISLAYGPLFGTAPLAVSESSGPGFTVSVVAGDREVRRRDRRLLQAFVNGRRVFEFALLQAAEFGFAGAVPGGWHPVAFIFIRIDPSLVDFNIHPAKKEVRFRNLSDVHHAVVEAARQQIAAEPASATTVSLFTSAASREHAARHIHVGRELTLPLAPDPVPSPPNDGAGIRFLGQVFGVFLVFELPDRLVILDQHAAHERILFERLSVRAPEMQEMLFPLCFDVSEEEESRLETAGAELIGLGVELRKAGARAFEVTALAEHFAMIPEEALIELIRGVGGAEWQYAFRATAACRMAIKEGDRVDPVTARELCAQALELPVPRCPHGRPIWHQLSEESLRKLVDRPIDRQR